MEKKIGVWFPCVRAGTGSDVFTLRLAEALAKKNIRTEITWLPKSAEYIPWLTKKPQAPEWATHVHINSWLHRRFIPTHLPVIVTSHLCVHDPVLTQYKGLLQHIYHSTWVKYCERNAFRLAAKVTAVSLYTAKKNEQCLNVKDITPIHNWIDSDVFSPAVNKENNIKFKLLFVGTLSKRKGADLLPKIMKILGEKYELYFTCDNSFYSQLNLPNNMISLGKVHKQSELLKLYQQSDALLFPSRLEGLSLAALEAQACGLPIITNNSSSMPEIVEEGLTGFLCLQDDISAFVAAIKKLAKKPELTEKMRNNARNHAHQFFTELNQIKKYIELYRTT